MRPIFQRHGDFDVFERLGLWVPKALGLSEAVARRKFEARELPLVVARRELGALDLAGVAEYPGHLVCGNFLEAQAALEGRELGALLPDFLGPIKASAGLVRVRVPEIDAGNFEYYLAWNPRLLRLNPHAVRERDLLVERLAKQMRRVGFK